MDEVTIFGWFRLKAKNDTVFDLMVPCKGSWKRVGQLYGGRNVKLFLNALKCFMKGEVNDIAD